MCVDILEGKELTTYRVNEHDFLMSIREGIYLDENEQPLPEFMQLVDEYERKLQSLAETTKNCCKGAPIVYDARGIATTTLVVRVVLKLD